ncbi:MAG: ABC transporter ATP-binding protein [Kiritimatiellae bacterium]|jgi:ABC-type branched-subunit amino acid transport system ATPase component|nr:ABC transporter ATP-binding protein [Kiritimatiellia bacterium]
MNKWLTVEKLSKNFGGVKALDEFSCHFEQGEVVGLIGPNGAGKTTFFNVLGGMLEADSGSAQLNKKKLTSIPAHRIANMGIARTFQKLRLIRQVSVLENVMLSFRNQSGENLVSLVIRWSKVRTQESENYDKALTILKRVGLQEKAGDLADTLSYGQQKLLTLACCIASDADLLLLDEPLAGVSPSMIEIVLEKLRELKNEGKTIVVIEHNLEAIMDDFDRVIFMDSGRKICEGKPDEIRNDPRVIEAYLK